MVDFVDVKSLTSWVSAVGVESVLEGMVGYIEDDFRRWSSFDKTPRVASHSLYGVIELMPTSDGETYGFKYVNGHPVNPKRGLQTVTAFGVLADVESGYPVFLSEMTVLTALRTAAVSVMAAKLLAPVDSKTLALIGTGAQSEFQALAFRRVLGVTDLRIWDTDPEAMEKFMTNVGHLGFDITVTSGAEDAVTGADIITTCTADKTNATILTDEAVGRGVHINAIGGDCPGKTELDSDLLRRSDIFVEYTEQTRIEGEIQQLDPDHPVTELWEVLTGEADGRTSSDQLTIFDSVGFAIEDFSALRFLRASIDGGAFSRKLDLIADPDDPKNLFSLLPSPRRTPEKVVRATGMRDRPVRIISVPLDLGASRRGTDGGPSAVRVAGLGERLRNLGYEVLTEVDIDVPAMETRAPASRESRFKQEILAVCADLAVATRHAMAEGSVPLVIGGDHSIAMGTIAGVAGYFSGRGQDLGLLWFDAHGDMNLPETSPSGNIHGMPLAHLLGYGDPDLAGIAGFAPAVKAENVALIGIRDIDDDEREIIRESGIRTFTMRDIDELGMREVSRRAIETVTSGTAGFHVSFDVDGCDPSVIPGSGTLVSGGVNFREAHQLLENCADTGLMTSMEVVELNPFLDNANVSAERAVDLIESAFGRSVL